jgi:hypothetical protein
MVRRGHNPNGQECRVPDCEEARCLYMSRLAMSFHGAQRV